ncbi:hypothetical protein JCM10449v2_000862 [Rhodotorula kratochvilovae]
MSYPYGLAPVLRDASQLAPAGPTSPTAIPVGGLLALLPTTPLVEAAQDFVRPQLGEQIWAHSHRAFLFAAAIQKAQFPSWEWHPEALYLACLFHDLGAIEANLQKTKASFEFYSAVLARNFLLAHLEGREQPDLVDSVCEAIWRHTDFVASQITVTGQLLQLGTLYDNIAANRAWIHPKTAAQIVERFPREGWSDCFHHWMKREVELKPWSHTTIFDFSGAKGEQVWDMVLDDELGAALKEA